MGQGGMYMGLNLRYCVKFKKFTCKVSFEFLYKFADFIVPITNFAKNLLKTLQSCFHP